MMYSNKIIHFINFNRKSLQWSKFGCDDVNHCLYVVVSEIMKRNIGKVNSR